MRLGPPIRTCGACFWVCLPVRPPGPGTIRHSRPPVSIAQGTAQGVSNSHTMRSGPMCGMPVHGLMPFPGTCLGARVVRPPRSFTFPGPDRPFAWSHTLRAAIRHCRTMNRQAPGLVLTLSDRLVSDRLRLLRHTHSMPQGRIVASGLSSTRIVTSLKGSPGCT